MENMKDYTQVMGYEIYREVLKVALFQVEERASHQHDV